MAVHEVGSPGRLDLHAPHLAPVDVREELVRPDLLPALRPVLGVLLEEPPNEVLARLRDLQGELDLLVLDGLLNLVLVVRVEGREAADHLVEQTAQRVEVHGLVVRVPEKHFRAKVLGGPTEGVAVLVAPPELLRKPEVRQLDVAVDPNQNVFGLQVPVKHVLVMKDFQRLHDLDDVEGGHSLGELVSLGEEVEQLTPHAQVHHQEELRFVLEGPVEVDDEEALLALSIYLTLSNNGGRGHARKQVLFVHDLNCVQKPAVLLPRHEHLRIPSLSDQFDQLEVVNCYVASVPSLFNSLFIFLNNFGVFIRLCDVKLTYLRSELGAPVRQEGRRAN